MQRPGARERVSLSVSLAATVEGYPQPVPVTLIDLSEAGCRMTGRSVLLVGAGIEFRLPLGNGVAPNVRARIRRCTPATEAGLLEYGVEFLSVPPDDLRAIHDFVKQGREQAREPDVTPARIDVEFPVTYMLGKNKDVMEGVAIDLGRGGLCLATPAQLPEGAMLTLRFTLPNGGGIELVMQGRIVQRRQQFREFQHNVSFISPDSRSIERIERFIRSGNP